MHLSPLDDRVHHLPVGALENIEYTSQSKDDAKDMKKYIDVI